MNGPVQKGLVHSQIMVHDNGKKKKPTFVVESAISNLFNIY